MAEKKVKHRKKELKKQYCFTLLPSMMDKVEKVADKDYASVSGTIEKIIREHFEAKTQKKKEE